MWIFGGLTPQACPTSIASCCCCCIFIHCAQLIRCTFSSSKCQLLLSLLLHRLHKSRQPQPAQRGGARGNCYCLAAICRECQRDHKPPNRFEEEATEVEGLLMLSCKRKGNRIANIAKRNKTLKAKKKQNESSVNISFPFPFESCHSTLLRFSFFNYARLFRIRLPNLPAQQWGNPLAPQWVSSLLNSSPFTNNRKICV